MTDLFPLPGDRLPKKWSNHLPGNYLTEEEFIEATKKRNEAYRQERQRTIDEKKNKALNYQQKIQQNGN